MARYGVLFFRVRLTCFAHRGRTACPLSASSGGSLCLAFSFLSLENSVHVAPAAAAERCRPPGPVLRVARREAAPVLRGQAVSGARPTRLAAPGGRFPGVRCLPASCFLLPASRFLLPASCFPDRFPLRLSRRSHSRSQPEILKHHSFLVT